jgi:hypothetical protein
MAPTIIESRTSKAVARPRNRFLPARTMAMRRIYIRKARAPMWAKPSCSDFRERPIPCSRRPYMKALPRK